MTIGGDKNKVPVNQTYYKEQLARQINFLNRSCNEFDNGNHDEAIRMATTLRVLLHDTNNSKSLFTHLGIKEDLNYVDTGIYRHLLANALYDYLEMRTPGARIASTSPAEVGLVELGVVGEGRVGWYAPLRLSRFLPGTPLYKAVPKESKFKFWWETPLVEGSSGKSFSRHNLVHIMANQDGGAHVDQIGLDADYQDLIIDTLGVQIGLSGDASEPPPQPSDVIYNVAFASVRQIVFELLQTISRYEYTKGTPGIFIRANPYACLPISPPPHRSLSSNLMPLVISTPQADSELPTD